MSDRCWVQIQIHPDDVHLIYENEGSGLEDYDELASGKDLDTPTFITYYEANYGLCDELDFLANEGARFVAQTGAGDEYEAARVVSYGGEYLSVNCDRDFNIVIPWLENVGDICLMAQINARAYTELSGRFLRELRETTNKPRQIMSLEDWTPCNEIRTPGG